MKPIHFRGNNYDPQMLQRLLGQGHRQSVATSDIITLIAVPSIQERIAVQVDSKFHLLTGSIDKGVETNELYVLSKPVLKKALVEPQAFDERRREQLSHRDQMRGQGFGHFGTNPGNGARPNPQRRGTGYAKG